MKTKKKIIRNIIIILLCLAVVGVAVLLIINGHVKSAGKDRILTVEQAAKLEDVICYIVTDEKESKRRTQDEETYILGELLWALHLYDVRVWFDDSDVLQAEDDEGNKWIGIEFYKFLTEECLDFEPDGTLSEGLYVEEELLEMYKAYSVKNGVIPGKPSQDEIGGGSDGDN